MTKLAISIKKTKLTQIGHVTHTTVLTKGLKSFMRLELGSIVGVELLYHSCATILIFFPQVGDTVTVAML